MASYNDPRGTQPGTTDPMRDPIRPGVDPVTTDPLNTDPVARNPDIYNDTGRLPPTDRRSSMMGWVLGGAVLLAGIFGYFFWDYNSVNTDGPTTGSVENRLPPAGPAPSTAPATPVVPTTPAAPNSPAAPAQQ